MEDRNEQAEKVITAAELIEVSLVDGEAELVLRNVVFEEPDRG